MEGEGCIPNDEEVDFPAKTPKSVAVEPKLEVGVLPKPDTAFPKPETAPKADVAPNPELEASEGFLPRENKLLPVCVEDCTAPSEAALKPNPPISRSNPLLSLCSSFVVVGIAKGVDVAIEDFPSGFTDWKELPKDAAGAVVGNEEVEGTTVDVSF